MLCAAGPGVLWSRGAGGTGETTLQHRGEFALGVLAVVLAAALVGCSSPRPAMTPPSLGAQAATPGEGEKGITVQSRYGHGSGSGVVRTGQQDQEVRLPNGTWISCKQDCRTTLREETVDF